MQTPSIFEDPKIRSLVHNQSLATGGPAGEALNGMEVLLQTTFEAVNSNTATIGLIATRINALDKKLDDLKAASNENQRLLNLLLTTR